MEVGIVDDRQHRCHSSSRRVGVYSGMRNVRWTTLPCPALPCPALPCPALHSTVRHCTGRPRARHLYGVAASHSERIAAHHRASPRITAHHRASPQTTGHTRQTIESHHGGTKHNVAVRIAWRSDHRHAMTCRKHLGAGATLRGRGCQFKSKS